MLQPDDCLFHTVLPDVENADQVSLDLQLQAAAVLGDLAQLADEKAAEGFVFLRIGKFVIQSL